MLRARIPAVAVTLALAGGCAVEEPAFDGDDGGDRPNPGGKADVFGDDDRLEGFELEPNSAPRRWLESTALMLYSSDKVTCDDAAAECSLVTNPLRLCTGDGAEDVQVQPKVRACSAFLVAPDVVVTAGHCAKSSTCDERFVFGYFYHESLGEDPTHFAPEDVYSCKQLIAQEYVTYLNEEGNKRPKRDYAVFQLDRPVTGRDPLPLRRSGRPRVGDDVWVIGNPSGLPAKASLGPIVAVPDDQSYIHTDTDTLPGNSGSLVIGAQSGVVEGIHVWGVEGDSYQRDEERDCSRVVPVCDEVDPDDPGCAGNLATRTDVWASYVPSCHGRCDEFFWEGDYLCHCDSLCEVLGDCCWDFEAAGCGEL